MGGVTSKTTAELLNEISINASMNTVMTCTTGATQQQKIEFDNISGNIVVGDIDQSETSAVSLDCLMDSNKQADIATSVANAIAQEAASKGESVLALFGNTHS